MLRYIILSTPRCGSSTFMDCAELVFGKGSFIREPLNPYENPKWHPSFLHGKSVSERVDLLTDPSCCVVGIKHVFSPFNRAMNTEDNFHALVRLLTLPDMRVVLLSRRNVFHQFVSIEIALQSGDWWSNGVEALPTILGPIKAGGHAPLTGPAIIERIEKLGQSGKLLRDICRLLGINWVEYFYEDLFGGVTDETTGSIASALAQFDEATPSAIDPTAIEKLITLGQRFDAMSGFYDDVMHRYPALKDKYFA
ncbi:MAG: hypothetical protein V4441_08480 [Pseudomonadota bacterium]